MTAPQTPPLPRTLVYAYLESGYERWIRGNSMLVMVADTSRERRRGSVEAWVTVDPLTLAMTAIPRMLTASTSAAPIGSYQYAALEDAPGRRRAGVPA